MSESKTIEQMRSWNTQCEQSRATDELLSYSLSAKGIQITWDRAMEELESHSCDYHDAIEEFIVECWNVHSRNGDTIDAKHLMDWLGY